jgi:hypothetical protein
MKTRLAQIAGDFARAVQGYHDVGQQSLNVVLLEPPPEILAQHVRAIDDASFWIAMCKFQQGDYRVAVDSLVRYRQQRPNGAWSRQCRYLLALSQAERGEHDAAIKELGEVGPEDPEYLGYQLLIKTWKSVETKSDGAAAR